MSNNIFLMGRGGKLEKFGAIVLPEFKTVNSIDWVINGVQKDWNNNQPNYYNYLFQASAKNNAIIKAKSRYVYGKGWAIDYGGIDPKTQGVELYSFLKKVKKNKFTPKAILDREIQNGFCAEMIDNEGGQVMPHHVDFGNVRVSKPEYDKENNLLPEKYFYTSDWSRGTQSKSNKDFVTFHPFTWGAEKMDKSKRYLVYYAGYQPNEKEYPLPEYMGGIPYIAADAEVGNFVKNNVENGFSSGVLVNFYKGDPTPEQKAQIEKQWASKKHGTENAGTNILSFNDDKDAGVEITPLVANGQDDRYINLNNQIRDEIFTAHTVSPLVVGMKGDNGFSNNADEKRTSIEDFTESYVKPIQEIFNEFMNSVLEFNEIKGKVYLQRLDPIMVQLGADVFVNNHTRAEIRKIFGSPEEKEEPQVTQVLKELNLKFSKFQDESILQSFASCGTLDTEFVCFDKRELFATDIFDAQNQGKNFRQEFTSKIESAILKMLIGDPKLTVKDLAKLLNDTPKNIGDIIKGMEGNGLIEKGQPTEEGRKQSEEKEIFTVYKYVLRNDALPLKGGESREFCKDMVKMSQTKSWTIEDIQQISNREGYDVFARRGGWYHNPDTDKNTPYCRHIFEQLLVRRK